MEMHLRVWNKSTCRTAVRGVPLMRSLQSKRSNLPTDTHLLYTPLIQTDVMHIADNSSFIKQPSHLTAVPQQPALAMLLLAQTQSQCSASFSQAQKSSYHILVIIHLPPPVSIDKALTAVFYNLTSQTYIPAGRPTASHKASLLSQNQLGSGIIAALF